MSQPAASVAPGTWRAPANDGQVLLWPAMEQISRQAGETRVRLGAEQASILGRPLADWRAEARVFVGHAGDRPLYVTGHQSELHHPGVWIKNAVIDALAHGEAGGGDRDGSAAAAAAWGGGDGGDGGDGGGGSGGGALHIAVDTDQPRNLRLRWPGFDEPFTDDPRASAAPWSGLLHPPTPAHLQTLIDAARSANRRRLAGPLLEDFLARCRAFLIDQRDAVAPLDLPSMLANAGHEIDWSLGLRHGVITLSPMLEMPAWAAFASHLCADADRFAAAYNAALADYRAAAGIDSADRPAPDLLITRQRIELPFWLDDLDAGTRRRAAVLRTGDGFRLDIPPAGARNSHEDHPAFTGDPDDAHRLIHFLRARRLRLAPRALALTAFIRLFIADCFVHGIGGGHYDQATDRLIRGYFNVEPPPFAVASATLFHPLAAGRERVCLPCLRHEGHQLAHDVLGAGKRIWLARIERESGFHARRRIFEQMHAARRAALPTDARWRAHQQRLATAQQQLAEESELFDRELFHLIQPPERLEALRFAVRAGSAGQGGADHPSPGVADPHQRASSRASKVRSNEARGAGPG